MRQQGQTKNKAKSYSRFVSSLPTPAPLSIDAPSQTMTHRVVETYTIRKSQDSRSNPYINQYELISLLGEGMHGKVMLARDTASPAKDKVAIKVMRRVDPHNRRLPKSNRPGIPPPTAQEETESKIRREIAIMKKCTHQNLVRLLEVIDDPASKKVYLVMENLAGGEVKWRSRDHSEPVLELSQIQRIMRDVTLGLEYLHHQGIIHRDIKPANLLWTEDRHSVKICDFGVSHFAGPSDLNDIGLSKTAGSPAFFAPELCNIPDISFEGSPSSSLSPKAPVPSTSNSQYTLPITKQIDIWALGVTLYCLLFAKPPWQGQTEYQMFRAICSDDFEIPDTMARDRIPTGGRSRRLEGKEIGWCIVSLLEGLLEKDQEKRLSLADVKKIPWVQNGVREPEKWLRETAPSKQSRVVITDEDTQSAIKQARFSYYPLFLARVAKMANKVKRVPLHLSKSSTTKTNDALLQTSPNLLPERPYDRGSSSSRNPAPSPIFRRPSLNKASSQRNRNTPDRKTKRFTFGSSPAPPTTAPHDDRRRNSTIGSFAGQHPQANEEVQGRQQLSSTSRAWGRRRQSDSVQTPSSSTRHLGFFKGTSNASLSVQTCPLDEPQRRVAPTAKGNLKEKISRVMRSSSVKRKSAVDRPLADELSKRISLDGERQPSRARTSAETLDVFRTREMETLGLTHAMRASSWGSPRDPEEHVDNDTRTSFDPPTSGMNDPAMTVGIQDFNKSVVQLGAGGYVDSPSSGNSNEFLSDNSQSMSPNSDSSISSESTTRQSYSESRYYPPRVTSPLAGPHATAPEDEDYSSEVFEDTGPEDENSSDEDVIEVKTRRPSTVLNCSSKASPLR